MASTMEFETGEIDVLATLHSGLIGDDRALDAFVRLCQPHVLTYVASRGAEHSEALTNLVLSDFVRAAPGLSFTYPQQLWSYIYRIARSRLADERRKTGREIRAERIELPDVEIAGFDDRSVDTIWVDGLLAELTTEQREVIRYRFWEDLTIEDTALRTGRTDTAVKALQRRALTALAAAVAVAAAVIIVLAGADTGPSRVQSSDPAGRSTTSQQDPVVPDDIDRSTLGPSREEDNASGRQAMFDRSTEPEHAVIKARHRATTSQPIDEKESSTTSTTTIVRPGPEDYPRLTQELARVIAELATIPPTDSAEKPSP